MAAAVAASVVLALSAGLSAQDAPPPAMPVPGLAPAAIPRPAPMPIPAPAPAVPALRAGLPAPFGNPAAPAPAASDPITTSAEGVEVAPGEKLVSLKFDGAPIQQVLQYYADITGRTLLQAPDVKGTVTLRSQSKLTIEESLQAIETVLAMNNITLLKVGEKFVKVIPIANARQEGMEFQVGGTNAYPDNDRLISEIIQLSHMELADAQTVVTGFIHTYGKVQSLPRINSLMITDAAANLNRIREILKHIDQPMEAREELRIIPIRYTKASEVQKKLDEIVQKIQPPQQTQQGTVARPRDSGSPTVERTMTLTPPGIIRPPVATAARTPEKEPEAAAGEGERGIISGTVKIMSDDRTGILIVVTRRENLPFIENIIKALDIETAPDVSVKVFRLEYAAAEDVARMLNDLIGASSAKDEPAPGASAAVGAAGAPGTLATAAPGTLGAPAANAKSTSGASEERSAALTDYLRRLDQRGQTAPEKSKIGELSSSNVKILSDKRTNGLIIMASKADMVTIGEIIKNMDIMLSQVLIEAVVLEVNLDRTLQTGLQWVQRSLVGYNQKSDGRRSPVFSFAGSGGGGALAPVDATTLTTPQALGTPPPGGLSYYFTHFDLNMDVVARMVETDSRTRILLSPVILSTDNTKATIDVSREDYFYKGQKFITTTSGSGTYVDDVEMKKVGVNLTVTPHINEKKHVVMEIVQKISNIIGTKSIGSGQWPIVASREMTANIAVQSGETIVLGGLTENDDTKSKTGIPILHRIPIIGLLFGETDKTLQSREVIVFITPYVLDTPEAMAEESIRRKESMNVSGLWQRGWSDSKLAEPSPTAIPSNSIRRAKSAPAATAGDPVVPAAPVATNAAVRMRLPVR